jgi:hypothetical protein
LAPEAAVDGLTVDYASPRVATNEVKIGIESPNTDTAEATRAAAKQFFRDRLPRNTWSIELTDPET